MLIVMIKNLRKLRNKKGVSQQQLAESIGVSQQSINKYENQGVEPDINTLICLADYFSTSIDYLVGHTEIERIIEDINKYDLNGDESKLIDNYRKLRSREKASIQEVINNYIDK